MFCICLNLVYVGCLYIVCIDWIGIEMRNLESDQLRKLICVLTLKVVFDIRTKQWLFQHVPFPKS